MKLLWIFACIDACFNAFETCLSAANDDSMYLAALAAGATVAYFAAMISAFHSKENWL